MFEHLHTIDSFAPIISTQQDISIMHPKLSMLLRIVLRAGQLGLRLVIPLTNGWNMADGQ